MAENVFFAPSDFFEKDGTLVVSSSAFVKASKIDQDAFNELAKLLWGSPVQHLSGNDICAFSLLANYEGLELPGIKETLEFFEEQLKDQQKQSFSWLKNSLTDLFKTKTSVSFKLKKIRDALYRCSPNQLKILEYLGKIERGIDVSEAQKILQLSPQATYKILRSLSDLDFDNRLEFELLSRKKLKAHGTYLYFLNEGVPLELIREIKSENDRELKLENQENDQNLQELSIQEENGSEVSDYLLTSSITQGFQTEFKPLLSLQTELLMKIYQKLADL